jgi:hypothetical protein
MIAVLANETVEKLILESTFPGQPLAEGPDYRSEGGLTDVSLRQGSVERRKSKQPPLYIHFQLGSQREAVHALLDTDVGKDRLDNAQSPGINALSLFTIDLCLHRIDQVRLLRIHRNGKIPAGGGRFAQTACLQRTGGTVLRAGMVDIIGTIAVGLVAGMASQFFSLRTKINLFFWIEREVSCREETGLGVGSLPAVETILEAPLLGKARIAFAELDVGDVRIDLFFPAYRQAVEGMIIAVRGQLLALKIGFIFSDGGDVFFAPFTIGLRFS